MKTDVLLLCVLLSIASVAGYAAEGSFPERPLRIVVPFAPGGGSDFVGRVLAAKMTEVLGQHAVVDNRPGAASLLATQLVAKAPNDGYTLLLQDLIPFVVNNRIYRDAGYDPQKSFSPVTQIATTPLILVVNPSVQATTVQEFITLAKAQPGKLSVANSGIGGMTHLAAAMFTSAAGIDLTMVAYKGTGPALTDVIGGRVHVIITTAPSVMPLIKSGRLRALAVASEKRLTLLPDAPTIQEAGLKGYVVTNTYIMITAARTPPPILEKLHDAFVKILQQPDVSSRMSEAIIYPTPSANPQELGATIAAEMVRWERIVSAGGMRAE